MGEYDRCPPTKMIMERLEEGSSEEEIIRYMHDTYVVSEKKQCLVSRLRSGKKPSLTSWIMKMDTVFISNSVLPDNLQLLLLYFLSGCKMAGPDG